jgi:type II secretory ATPase GspE/PulE/Tfp pilus assembly ATPase PilB-like protein
LQLTIDPNIPIWHPVGCQHCEGTGYKGRIGVHEVVRVDENFERLIVDQAPGGVLRQAAQRAGMVPMREDAIAKIRAGLTSVEDVMRQVYVKVEDYEVDAPASPQPTVEGSEAAALPAPGQ